MPPEIRGRALEILEDYVVGLASQGTKQADGVETARFWGMHTALRDVGAVTQADVNDITARRDAMLGEPPSRPREKAPPRPPDELLRVVAGPQENRGGVRVTAAELFTSFVRLWWHRVASPEELAERDRERLVDQRNPLTEWSRAARKFKLRDDLRTEYEAETVGSDEDTPWLWMMPWRSRSEAPQPLPLFGRAIFRPSVPAEATWLEAVSGSDRFVVDLTA